MHSAAGTGLVLFSRSIGEFPRCRDAGRSSPPSQKRNLRPNCPRRLSLFNHNIVHRMSSGHALKKWSSSLSSQRPNTDMRIDLGRDNRASGRQWISQNLSADERSGRRGRCTNDGQKIPHPIEQDNCYLMIAGPTHGLNRHHARPSCHNDSLGLLRTRLVHKPMIPITHNKRAALHTQAGVVCNCRQNAGLDLQELGPVSIRSFVSRSGITLNILNV
jgi:hypothetical protein